MVLLGAAEWTRRPDPRQGCPSGDVTATPPARRRCAENTCSFSQETCEKIFDTENQTLQHKIYNYKEMLC